MPIGTLIDFYGGMEIGSVNNYFRTVSTQNQFNLIELNSNIQLRKYFLRGGFHFQNKLIGFSTIFKGGRYYFEEGVINLEGESSNIFLHEFLLISRFPSGNYLESTLKLFVGKENIQGYIGITRLDTFHNLNIGEKNNLINFGLSVDIDNFYRGFRRIRKNKN